MCMMERVKHSAHGFLFFFFFLFFMLSSDVPDAADLPPVPTSGKKQKPQCTVGDFDRGPAT